ncbi:MAG: FecR domain-containing protein, partial [Bacteroidales bacterium]|nr:FecR domain-containing protein [Bacteroidales bacterium]
KKSKKLLVIYVAAASILLVIASTFFIGQLYQSTIRISTFQTTKKIVLSDGTVVDLNRNSQIEYPRKFKGNYRQVKLMKGEAFFTVSSDPLRPFLVYTPAASIKVLGTRFNVIVDREGNVEVLVQSGRVSFHASETNESLILTPNQKAIYAAGSKAMVKSDTVDWNQLAWCTSRFIFKEADLAYVYGVLSRTYGKTIVPDTQILRNKLTATYEKLELDDILQIIDKTFILKTTRLNDTLYLVRQTQP